MSLPSYQKKHKKEILLLIQVFMNKRSCVYASRRIFRSLIDGVYWLMLVSFKSLHVYPVSLDKNQKDHVGPDSVALQNITFMDSANKEATALWGQLGLDSTRSSVRICNTHCQGSLALLLICGWIVWSVHWQCSAKLFTASVFDSILYLQDELSNRDWKKRWGFLLFCF